MAKDDKNRAPKSILGDINPEPAARDQLDRKKDEVRGADIEPASLEPKAQRPEPIRLLSSS